MKKTIVFLVLLMCGLNILAQTDSIYVDNSTVQDSIIVKPQTSALNSQLSTLNSQLLIGFLSYDSALVNMPEYAIAQKRIADTREAYDAEMQRVEKEFNDKYEEFLENRKDYPRTILLKRQNELQDLLQKNIEFKDKSRQELQQIERQILAPLRIRLNETIATIARVKGLSLVVNTDADACPFIEPMTSVDLNEEVRQALNQ